MSVCYFERNRSSFITLNCIWLEVKEEVEGVFVGPLLLLLYFQYTKNNKQINNQILHRKYSLHKLILNVYVHLR